MRIDDGQFFLTNLQSGLQTRIVVAPSSGSTRFWQIVYLQSGTVEIASSGRDGAAVISRIDAPGLLCQPVTAHRQIRLLAGSSGVHLAVDEFGMAAALGSKPEAVELRMMVSDLAALSLMGQADHEAHVIHALNAIGWELDRQSPGQITVIEAQLRCLLVHLWRNSHRADQALAPGGSQTVLLRRFRQLVETHFRNRWRVSDYAAALGTTTDRLHNLTTQSLQRAPIALIHERSLREAKALLTRSNMTLEQVAAYLGFNTSAQFSAFFRKHEKEPPGRYRALHAIRQADRSAVRDPNFTDWP